MFLCRPLQKEASFCYALINFGILPPFIKYVCDRICTYPTELALGTGTSVLPLAYVTYGCTTLPRLLHYFIAIS